MHVIYISLVHNSNVTHYVIWFIEVNFGSGSSTSSSVEIELHRNVPEQMNYLIICRIPSTKKKHESSKISINNFSPDRENCNAYIWLIRFKQSELNYRCDQYVLQTVLLVDVLVGTKLNVVCTLSTCKNNYVWDFFFDPKRM